MDHMFQKAIEKRVMLMHFNFVFSIKIYFQIAVKDNRGCEDLMS